MNDDSLVFGLDRSDIMAIGVAFYFWQLVFLPLNTDYLSLIVTVVVTAVLIHIRLKYRRKIIRDTLRFYYFKWFRGGVFYGP